MSIYTSGDIAHKCNVSTRTIQYYDKQGILSPNYTTET
ncbi:MerR family DNA-binding transcriptional regulator, partial [Bacillus thuringiensis]